MGAACGLEEVKAMRERRMGSIRELTGVQNLFRPLESTSYMPFQALATQKALA